MTFDPARLPWLPPPPADFRARCKALDATQERRGQVLRDLADHALDMNQLTRLAASLARARQAGADLSPLAPFRLGLVSNATTALVAPVLAGSALRHGLALEMVETDHDQGVQAALDPNSPLQAAGPDAVLLAFDHRILPAPGATADDADAADRAVAAATGMVDTIVDGLARGCGAPTILQTIAPAPDSLLGSLARTLPGSPRALAAAVNDHLASRAAAGPDLLLDVAALAETVGLARWHDERQWHLARLSFAAELMPLYADHVARLLAALRGKARKCLVLDLDNTLWGGVVGDDGTEGLVLGQGDPAGEAFLAVQRAALDLRRHGVVLAVCSKNDDAVARAPFRDHPDMVLGEDDIAVFQANWADKASNLEAIAGALNIGTDALVLLDDNPAERAQVRAALPQVAVPELPDDPALYVRYLLAAGYFESVGFSADDRQRAADYQANARRAEMRGQARDLDGFLRSLDMRITFAPFDPTGRARIAQLINKSNQFNLTTRRYTEAQVAAMEGDPALHTVQVRLRDTFGDTGMISVVICRAGDGEWEVDTWLMSCRVLGRRVEEAVLAHLAQRAQAAGATALVGRFIPSGRNELVRDHYAKLGFAAAGRDGAAEVWRLDLDAYRVPDLPLAMEAA
ncbi:MAG: HAD-IIIC family phosphatase [Hyphomicrobiales bacterium]|nr:HAD-IIIC family phosphatase [Hyphomicrobiales bacterium]MCP5370533.1 HAD-IIIC family phosphatase [Hyphomicrobiales bacterium]